MKIYVGIFGQLVKVIEYQDKTHIYKKSQDYNE